MKTPLPLFVVTLLMSCTLSAQTDSITPVKIFRIWATPFRHPDAGQGSHPQPHRRTMDGYLYEVRDSSVMISDLFNKQDYITGKFNVSEAFAGDINVIKLRKKGALGLGILIGGLAGAAIGIILGIKQHTNGGTEGDQELQHAGLVIIPALFTGLGVGIGATIGGMKITIPIKGSREKFDLERSGLNRYSIKPNPAW